MTPWEREEEALEREYVEGNISAAEYNKRLRDMQREQRDEIRGLAEEAAERAYNDTINGW